MTQFPSIGRQVHYVLQTGEHRAATVVNADEHDTACTLMVQLDPFQDFNPGDMVNTAIFPTGCANVRTSTAHPAQLAVQSAVFDEETKRPGTWHWPEMVKPPEAADPFKYSDRQRNGA